MSLFFAFQCHVSRCEFFLLAFFIFIFCYMFVIRNPFLYKWMLLNLICTCFCSYHKHVFVLKIKPWILFLLFCYYGEITSFFYFCICFLFVLFVTYHPLLCSTFCILLITELTFLSLRESCGTTYKYFI